MASSSSFTTSRKHGVTEPLVQDWLKDVKLDALAEPARHDVARPVRRHEGGGGHAAGRDRVDDPQAVGDQAAGAGGQRARQVARLFRGRIHGAVCVSLRAWPASVIARHCSATQSTVRSKTRPRRVAQKLLPAAVFNRQPAFFHFKVACTRIHVRHPRPYRTTDRARVRHARRPALPAPPDRTPVRARLRARDDRIERRDQPVGRQTRRRRHRAASCSRSPAIPTWCRPARSNNGTRRRSSRPIATASCTAAARRT